MKTLTNHTLLYDDECPMCDLYTSGFIKAGMMDRGGRVCYSSAMQTFGNTVDLNRARNEIALVDRNTGAAIYGVDSLFAILGHSFPWLTRVFSNNVVRWCTTRLYRFVSFNRKVIAPGAAFEGPRSCTPDYSLKYRLAYIFLAWLATASIVAAYSHLLVPFIPPSDGLREYLLSGGLIVAQAAVVLVIKKDRLVHYLGNLMTISLAGALMLLVMMPLISLSWYGSAVTSLAVLGIVLLWMFAEHIRRVRILGLPGIVTGLWIAYRLVALWIIL